jgi:hypothetical protein
MNTAQIRKECYSCGHRKLHYVENESELPFDYCSVTNVPCSEVTKCDPKIRVPKEARKITVGREPFLPIEDLYGKVIKTKGLSWDAITKDVTRAVRKLYPESRFVKSRIVAEHIEQDADSFPSFRTVSPRKTRVRVNYVLEKILKWEVFSQNGHGKCFVKKEGWT